VNFAVTESRQRNARPKERKAGPRAGRRRDKTGSKMGKIGVVMPGGGAQHPLDSSGQGAHPARRTL